jgi:Ser/Thr protein kinase RdoA (MazF antagonist)
LMKLKTMVKDTFTIAESILGNWRYDAGSLRYWRASTNFVYRFQRHGEGYFLRFINDEENTAGQIQAEIDFLQYLDEHRYPAAIVVPSRNGKLMETVDTPLGTCFAVVFREVSGAWLNFEQMNEEEFTGWGKALGELHRLSMKYKPAGPVRGSWKDRLEFIRKVLSDFPEESAAEQELEQLKAWLDSLPAAPENYGLIHYDFQQDNVFLDPVSGQYNIIDFDDAQYHWYVMDISAALEDVGELPDDRVEAGRRCFFAGYRSVCAIDEVLFQQLPLFQRYADMYRFARIMRSLKDSDVENPPEWLIQLKPRLQGRCDSLRKGFERPWNG